jgi:Alr-MurF fusion protein
MTNLIPLTDSRQLTAPAQTIFFAIRGERHDGHQFIGDLYRQGVRHFVVEQAALTPDFRAELTQYHNADFREVDSSIAALQQEAVRHRAEFGGPVVGITGSNGKTIVKEWLAQLLADDFAICKSPRSYNSQIGVPLSVWPLNESQTLGVFEAGVSKAHEMERLEPIIRPTIGVFTNIGPAHDEGFQSRKQKVAEKLRLFTRAQTLIYCRDYADIDEEVNLLLRAVNPDLQTITWSWHEGADFQVTASRNTLLLIPVGEKPWRFQLPFSDRASVENLVHCLLVAHVLEKTSYYQLRERVRSLRPVAMRLQRREGIGPSTIIDDSYNNDLAGLRTALGFLHQQTAQPRRVVVLSDVLQTGQGETELYQQIGQMLRDERVDQLIGVGPMISRNSRFFAPNSLFFPDTDALLADFPVAVLPLSAVLVKGARSFRFERVVARLERKAHGTVLHIDLDALTHNLNYYRQKAGRDTKIMVMVKAFAYGSGSAEVAQWLQFHRVDYLAVAYADEGVTLRENGVTLPIMVMNPAPEAFPLLLQHQLEPEIYSRRLLDAWADFVTQTEPQNPLPTPAKRGRKPKKPIMRVAPAMHLKIDTGMHRLGFTPDELPAVLAFLKTHPALRVATMFSHLVGSDEARLNDFSRQQYTDFDRATTQFTTETGYQPIRHLLNSAGIVRFPEYTLDMVRLGIGLYGVEASRMEPGAVRTVGTLRTVVSQVKSVRAGESVGYSRSGVLSRDSRIATLAIGYADGFDRRLGNGVGEVLINEKRCPTVGNVCMDMTMVDVTDADCAEGDEALIFGANLPISEMATRIGTIPYELLTGISERVKRVFFQ